MEKPILLPPREERLTLREMDYVYAGGEFA